MYGKAEGMKIKWFSDGEDGSVVTKVNSFFRENPEIEVLDVKLSYNPNDNYIYSSENILVVYRTINK